MVMVIRVASDKGARATKGVMVLVTRAKCNKEINGFGGKSNGNGNKGGNNQLAMGA